LAHPVSIEIFINISLLIINRDVTCVLCVFAVLLYVREQHEAVFTAILLKTPTLPSLIHAVRSHRWIFTARRYASVVYAVALCLCVSQSVTSWTSTKTAQRRI